MGIFSLALLSRPVGSSSLHVHACSKDLAYAELLFEAFYKGGSCSSIHVCLVMEYCPGKSHSKVNGVLWPSLTLEFQVHFA